MYEVVEAAFNRRGCGHHSRSRQDERLVGVTRRGMRVHAGWRWTSRVDGQKRTPFRHGAVADAVGSLDVAAMRKPPDHNTDQHRQLTYPRPGIVACKDRRLSGSAKRREVFAC
jgi:hypothetical protein